MGVKTSSKRAAKKAPARKPLAKKSAAKKTASKKAPLSQSVTETKYECKKCKRKITVLVGVSSVWCNRCSTVMQPI